MQKQCPKCHETKDESEFAKKRDKRASECKSCHQIYCKSHYIRNKQSYFIRTKRVKLELKQWLIDLKDQPCHDCKVKYPHYVMDFDHKENKSFNVSSAWTRRSKKLIIEEITKCDLVCANCHRIRTYDRYRDVA